ncbi:MAG: hypothetical protein WCC48_04435 [Anaeromyxobacteraceae bacterium]
MIPIADRPAAQARVERFVRERPQAVLYDPTASVLLDVASGKPLPLDWSILTGIADGVDADTKRPYLLLSREDGLMLALADQGIVFAPSIASTGPISGLPNAVCFRDLESAEAQLLHYLRDHPGEPPAQPHVSLFALCLAVVDGARAIGFDTGREERRLEATLAELEARKKG